MISMTIVVKVRPEKREEFLQTIHSLNNGREKQEGLRRSILYQEIEDKTGFGLIYEWETPKDMDRYLGAEKFKVLLGALKILGKKSEIRYGHFYEKVPDLVDGAYEPCSRLKTGSEYF